VAAHRDPLRRKGSISVNDYVHLWGSLLRQNIFNTDNGKEPRMDILDEFTLHFEARVGRKNNKFHVYGHHRPEASKYFAIRSLIDHTAKMPRLWKTHKKVAKIR